MEKCSQEVSSAKIEEKDIISVLPSTLSMKVSIVVGFNLVILHKLHFMYYLSSDD